MTFPRRPLKKHQDCGHAGNGFDASSRRQKQCPWSSAPHRALIINYILRDAGKMSRIHKRARASSKIPHLRSHFSINDRFRLTLSHTVPFPLLFFCTEQGQKSLKLSKNAGNGILSCCQPTKLGFKYIFNIRWQKLRTGLEPEIWVKSEGLFLPICHTLQGSEQLSEKEMLNHKPSLSRANPLVSAFPRNQDIAKPIRSSLKLQIFHIPHWPFLLEKCP